MHISDRPSHVPTEAMIVMRSAPPAEATTLLATSERRLSLLGIAGCDPAHTTGNRGRWHRERPDLSTTHHDR
jgi:hypothetical protein